MFTFVFNIALAQSPTIESVQPVVTRAGFLRYDHDLDLEPQQLLDAIGNRLDASTDPRDRAALAEWFARTARQHEAADQAVARALATPHVEVRRTLVEALIRAPEAQLRPLHVLVDDPEPSIRAAALDVVARSESPQLATHLQKALNDPNADVRATALRNLRARGIQAVVTGLLQDPSDQVRLQAALYLKRHEPGTFEQKRPELLADPDPRLRRLAE